jgi:hypothetical protein
MACYTAFGEAHMALPDIQQLLDSKVLLSALSVAVGTLVGNFVAVYRARVRVLEYTVAHERIGLAANDPIFGNVRVQWQGTDVTNLHNTVVTVVNGTSVDFTNLRIKIYTGNTLLLTERTEIQGTTYLVLWSPQYQNAMQVTPGSQPTAHQFNTYYHSREYLVPVLNRGQRAVFHFLTTVPQAHVAEGPGVWADLLHPGAQVSFRPLTQQIHGVPVRLALPLGLILGLVVLVAASVWIEEVWAASLLCMLVGLFAQSVGAAGFRAAVFVKRLVLR